MTSPPHDRAPSSSSAASTASSPAAPLTPPTPPAPVAFSGDIEAGVFAFLQHRIRDVLFVLEVTPPERYRFIYVNAAFEATTGIPAAAVVGKFVEEVIPAESIALVRTNYRRALDSGASVHWDEVSEYPTGRKVGEVTVTPVPTADGQGRMLIGTVHDVTERHLAQARLAELEERSRLALEAAGAGSFDWHGAANRVYVSDQCRQLLGFASDSYDLETLKLPRLVHTDELPAVLQTLARLRSGDADTFSLELRMRHLYGHWVWLRCQGRAVRGRDGGLARVFGACSDITRAREAEEAMERASLVFAHSSDAIAISDSDGRIIMVNPGFTRMRGYERDEIIGQSAGVYDDGMAGDGPHEALRTQARRTGHAQGEVWSRHKDGHPIAEQRSLTAVRVADGAVRHYIEIASDITKAKQDEERLWRQANYDSLTGLPNRHLFLDRLRQAILNTHRGEHPAFSLLYIDLDQFKEVNDTLGHPVGDQLLKEAALRLLRCTRETDTVSRIGGDEFTVLLVDLDSLDNEHPHVIERVAHGIIEAMSQPFQIDGETLHVSASIGVTHFPADGGDADSLLKHADQAMYAAKQLGRNRFAYFSPAMQARAQQRRRTSDELRQAIARGELHLHYQPIVEMATGQIVKAEALVRWRHPDRGWVSPAEFIPLAEETGLIFEIGEWVFRTAVSDAARWRREGRAIQVGINVSPLQIAKGAPSFARCMAFLAAQRLPRHAIIVEVTEGTLLQHDRHVEERLRELGEHGLALALDDFGTGYSSLSYLQRYRFEFLKIDRAFVGNMRSDSRQLALCRTIIAMAHTLDMRVISEGIADEQAAALLRAAGCDYGQGFHFHQPMPAAAFESLLQVQS